jgi:hypothetical protein
MGFKKGTFASKCVCSEADLKFEQEANAKLHELRIPGRISAYSIPHADGTVTYGLVFTCLGKSNTIEQDRPFILDEIMAMAEKAAPQLTALARPRWTGEAGHLPTTYWPSPQEIAAKSTLTS